MKYLIDTCVISELAKAAPNEKVAKVWGKIQGQSEVQGHPMPTIDSLIAATGVAHGLIVVTRNTTDMEQNGVSLLNPWE